MSVRPRELLDHALELQSGTGEACARAAISRAYYGALHRVHEVLPEAMLRDDDEGNTHLRIIAGVDRLARSIEPGRQAAIHLGRTLRQLRRSRVLADYDLEEQLSDTEVLVTMQRAEKVFELCDQVERQRVEVTRRP